MERKIGEIFEYNGEWYQCLKSENCDECAFSNNDCTDNPNLKCRIDDRTDNCCAIFKKLEKVGEPFTSVGKLYQHYKVFDIDNVYGDVFWCVHNYKAKTLTIEIKQKQEDMEEKKQKLDKLVDDYMACRIKYAEFDKEIKALYDKEESESTLKEFDLEAAKQGKPVCTRDGRKARIICFDMKGDICPIVAAVEENGVEYLYRYDEKGLNCYKKSNEDLMMLHEKKEGWVNVYSADTTFYFVEGMVYDTKEEAIKHINPDNEIYSTTVKVCLEE